MTYCAHRWRAPRADVVDSLDVEHMCALPIGHRDIEHVCSCGAVAKEG